MLLYKQVEILSVSVCMCVYRRLHVCVYGFIYIYKSPTGSISK